MGVFFRWGRHAPVGPFCFFLLFAGLIFSGFISLPWTPSKFALFDSLSMSTNLNYLPHLFLLKHIITITLLPGPFSTSNITTLLFFLLMVPCSTCRNVSRLAQSLSSWTLLLNFKAKTEAASSSGTIHPWGSTNHSWHQINGTGLISFILWDLNL